MNHYEVYNMSVRIQVTLDEESGNIIKSRADELGLSMSSYGRIIFKEALKKPKFNQLDLALREKSEAISLEEFKQQLEDLK
jgi:hypothetical protein